MQGPLAQEQQLEFADYLWLLTFAKLGSQKASDTGNDHVIKPSLMGDNCTSSYSFILGGNLH